ncbi:hypothetical protein KIL84_012468 [Mauremys mutica]|uniref:Uncharacterized protein n=1 Tax=Mauremys mutica TaxID=74926 RepID=A0A9D4B1E4_9SAUR|nr:hypothetical protein KIL84_012468 [Mauremys mutica]
MSACPALPMNNLECSAGLTLGECVTLTPCPPGVPRPATPSTADTDSPPTGHPMSYGAAKANPPQRLSHPPRLPGDTLANPPRSSLSSCGQPGPSRAPAPRRGVPGAQRSQTRSRGGSFARPGPARPAARPSRLRAPRAARKGKNPQVSAPSWSVPGERVPRGAAETRGAGAGLSTEPSPASQHLTPNFPARLGAGGAARLPPLSSPGRPAAARTAPSLPTPRQPQPELLSPPHSPAASRPPDSLCPPGAPSFPVCGARALSHKDWRDEHEPIPLHTGGRRGGGEGSSSSAGIYHAGLRAWLG